MGLPTFQALGVISKTSSKANIPCGYMPWETYKSANSAHASASVGDASRNLFKAVIASMVLFKDFNTTMRRFDTG